MGYLIDRRLNGNNKNAVNRERFLRRYREQIRGAVKDMIGKRSITDMEKSGEVHVPRRDVAEPSLSHGAGGDREFVLPGNRQYTSGDRLPRPQKGGGGGNGTEGGNGEAEDDFVFSLSRDEFMDIFFEDLELPHLARSQFGDISRNKLVRAGYSTAGNPSNLSVIRTLSRSLARRIALGSVPRRELDEALAALAAAEAAGDASAVSHWRGVVADCEQRLAKVPFLEEIDVRYRHRAAMPEPVARAAMFCLMDVSASMDEGRKDLAKRFFTLLYLFLTRKYERVDLVFIRHTDDAEEVDEKTFFHDTKSGGTVVFSALELMHEIAAARYGDGSWNIYAAQASDGDAFGSDPAKSARFMKESLLPLTRYFAYLELTDGSESHASALWAEYELLRQGTDSLAMRHAASREEIYPVFRDLFKKEMQ